MSHMLLCLFHLRDAFGQLHPGLYAAVRAFAVFYADYAVRRGECSLRPIEIAKMRLYPKHMGTEPGRASAFTENGFTVLVCRYLTAVRVQEVLRVMDGTLRARSVAGKGALVILGVFGINGVGFDAVPGGEVYAQDVGYCSGELLCVERTVTGSFSKHGYAFSKGHEPGFSGAGGILPMVRVLGAYATAVVAGDKIGGFALVEGI